ncbi:unnamed protein product [Lactuca saligna]|uniref:Transposase Tnp1/En/Spm-like domain-containing protein n=1 Tax=Lactuca saligna TaxID=75948 RepID=A0AA35Z541_LACSI|nr:unnamed protein product [Lactuca saligna]
MYKYGSNGETGDMLEFDVTFDLAQDSALLDLDDDFLCTRPDGEGILVLCFCDMESDSASDHDEESKQRGPTTKTKANKVKLVITYNKKGVPVGKEATKLSTFEGLVARIMVPITYDSWLEVSEEVREGLWQYVLEKSMKAKNTRAHHKYNHRLSRKGYAGLINDIMQETDKTEEEIDRTLLWKKARELKTGGYDADVKTIVDKIDELQKSGSFGEVTCGTHDVLTEALGTQEQRGHIENERVDKRINKLEDDLEKLKRGVLNVSEAASCQIGGVIEDFENQPYNESLNNSCLLAVEFAANVVAKGTIMKASDENIEVMIETILQGEALVPFPLEEEFIVKVKDALGHILSWPRHLVIRCSDLGKVWA